MLLWELREGGYFKAFSSSDSMHPDSLQSISLGSHDLLPSSVNFHLDYHEFTLDPNQELAALVRVDPQRFGLFLRIYYTFAHDCKHFQITIC